jgi:putative membrane protein insertion efficiency factor
VLEIDKDASPTRDYCVAKNATHRAARPDSSLRKERLLGMTRLNQFAQRVVVLMLRGYKWAISPLFPPACRFVPTCSEYAMEAVERYGAWRGAGMAAGRLLRCHPLARGGYDPVEGLRQKSAREVELLSTDRREPAEEAAATRWV